MSIFSRLADIVNSNLNAILANAEDPEKIIRLVIQEMEDTLVEVRSQAVRAIAERKELERRADGLGREEAEWQRRAELALTRNREDLAKAALQARHNVERSREALDRQIATLVTGLDQQNDDIGKLQAKLADARARQRSIAARHKVANGRLKLREKLYDERITDAFSRFEQVERALDEAEGRVEAYDLGRPGAPGAGRPTLEQELAGLETDAAVEDELAALKQRLGNRLPVPDKSA
jgi:phage shock protein A